MRTQSTLRRSSRKYLRLITATLLLALFTPSVVPAQRSASKKKSRSKAKTVAQATVLIHIPPIDMQGGSFTIFTEEQMQEPTPNDHAGSARNRPYQHLFRNGVVERIRIINTDGRFLFDRSDDAIWEAQIEIWLESLLTDDADLLVRKDDHSNYLAIETKMQLAEDHSGMHVRKTRTYPNFAVQIKRVRVTLKSGQVLDDVDSTDDQQIYHVFIWTRR